MRALGRTLVEATTLFGIIGQERLRFLVYTCVNIVLGALGILAPIAAGVWAASERPVIALARVLNDGNGYTFAVALLATSSAFLLNDIVDRERPPSAYIGARMAAGLLGVVLLLTLSLFSGMHFFAKVMEVSASAVGGPLAGPAMQWTGQQTWQSALLVVTILYGVWLFCLQHVDAHDDYGQGLRDNRTRLVTGASEPTTASGIQA
jgi:hypothetical protein